MGRVANQWPLSSPCAGHRLYHCILLGCEGGEHACRPPTQPVTNFNEPLEDDKGQQASRDGQRWVHARRTKFWFNAARSECSREFEVKMESAVMVLLSSFLIEELSHLVVSVMA